MQTETGESVASMNRREDAEKMPMVLSALRDGAVLRVHHKIRRVATEGLPEKDIRNGRTISFAGLRRLERDGVVVPCGVDRYMLAPTE